jgi:hypothetical protein
MSAPNNIKSTGVFGCKKSISSNTYVPLAPLLACPHKKHIYWFCFHWQCYQNPLITLPYLVARVECWMGGLPITVQSPSEHLSGRLVSCLAVPTQTAAASTRWLNFWWKDFTGTHSQSVARLHFELFCKSKLSHPDFELLYNDWIKDSLLFLSGHLSTNLE